jgi:hypothetical protein
MTPEERQEAKDRLLAGIRAYKLAELRREHTRSTRWRDRPSAEYLELGPKWAPYPSPLPHPLRAQR